MLSLLMYINNLSENVVTNLTRNYLVILSARIVEWVSFAIVVFNQFIQY